MEKRRYKIKPPEVWTQVRKDYLSGLDAKTVAARHDVTEAAIRARATKEGWSRHPRSEAATPAPQPLSPDDAADLSPDDPNDPVALARAAAQASGRALHAQDFAQARALAALAETYRKLADRDGPGRAARLTVKNAPLQLVFDILTNEAEAERRFAMNTSDKSDWELRGQYWQAKQKLTRANDEWSEAQLARRVQLDRRIAALEDQLRAAGLDPVIEREQDRRISQGIDLYLGTWRGIVTMEEWDKTLDEL
ncbi:hypothetical protein [Brevundimonas vesicularis]|uniref:Terminase small subunit n=1 Tax=Brevundimonas vesicularis TaxID=41276 RepID=A0A1Z3U661_BREVE|nr:hypothetical protein [Brevundimonas vesicularis]ASE38758.1 hypothetical protein CEP68_04185 [Brevundimonas vesicularis]MDX2336604.1 hypothetical protein [Brevundimonas vesicularis]